jgi:hypothetical protein
MAKKSTKKQRSARFQNESNRAKRRRFVRKVIDDFVFDSAIQEAGKLSREHIQYNAKLRRKVVLVCFRRARHTSSDWLQGTKAKKEYKEVIQVLHDVLRNYDKYPWSSRRKARGALKHYIKHQDLLQKLSG